MYFKSTVQNIKNILSLTVYKFCIWTLHFIFIYLVQFYLWVYSEYMFSFNIFAICFVDTLARMLYHVYGCMNSITFELTSIHHVVVTFTLYNEAEIVCVRVGRKLSMSNLSNEERRRRGSFVLPRYVCIVYVYIASQ